jgi:hypothetical protein
MAAFAPRETSALTWTEHIDPAPPVQKTTLFLKMFCWKVVVLYGILTDEAEARIEKEMDSG